MIGAAPGTPTMTRPLSPTQAQIHRAAAQHRAGLAEAPPNLPGAARNTVLHSMLKVCVLEEVPDAAGGARCYAAGQRHRPTLRR